MEPAKDGDSLEVITGERDLISRRLVAKEISVHEYLSLVHTAYQA